MATKILSFEEFDKMTLQDLFDLVKEYPVIHITGPLPELQFDVYACIYPDDTGKPYIDAIVKVARNRFMPKDDEERKLVHNMCYYIEYKFYNPENIIHKSDLKYAKLLDEVV